MTLPAAPARSGFAAAGAGAARGSRALVPPIVAFVGALAAWELTVRILGLKQFILPRPLAIAEAWQTYLPELSAAAGYTLGEVLGGLAIGTVAGLVVGGLTARFGLVRASLLPIAVAANSVPIIAFAPIFNNWFGLDSQFSKAMIAAVLVFFPVMISTVRGLTTVDPAAIELMRAYATSEVTVFRKVRIPNSLPFVFTSLKVATTLATIGAIVAEYFGAPRISLGQYIATYSSFLNFERSWAAIVFAAAIGIGLYLAVVVLERLLMPWAVRSLDA